MKSVRFSQVVKAAGRPVTHLQLASPKKDPVLQSAVKRHRLMTIHQRSTGHAADYGSVGYDGEARGELLVFPRSLSRFSGKRVVGVKYELLEQPANATAPRKVKKAPARKKLAAKKNYTAFLAALDDGNQDDVAEVRPIAKARANSAARTKTAGKAAPEESRSARKARPKERREKVIPFPRESCASVEAELKRVRADIKRALRALEQGRQVQAFQILKHHQAP